MTSNSDEGEMKKGVFIKVLTMFATAAEPHSFLHLLRSVLLVYVCTHCPRPQLHGVLLLLQHSDTAVSFHMKNTANPKLTKVLNAQPTGSHGDPKEGKMSDFFLRGEGGG